MKPNHVRELLAQALAELADARRYERRQFSAAAGACTPRPVGGC